MGESYVKNERIELSELQREVERKKELERELPILWEKRSALEAEEKRLREQLRYEEEDVERLENKTLYSFLYTLLGKREERLEREISEAEDAKAAHAAAREMLDELQKTVARMEREAERLKYCERRYADAIAEYVRSAGDRFREVDSQRAKEVLRLETEYTTDGERIEHLKKALEAGRIAVQRADAVIESLTEAMKYSKYDRDWEMYNCRDEAQSRWGAFQIQLDRFRELFPELEEMETGTELQLTQKGVVRYLEIILPEELDASGGASLIHSLENAVESVGRNVRAAVGNIEERLGQLEQRRQKTYQRLEELLGQ